MLWRRGPVGIQTQSDFIFNARRSQMTMKFTSIFAIFALFIGAKNVWSEDLGRFRIRPQGNCERYFAVNQYGDLEGNARFRRLSTENPNFILHCTVKVRALNSEGRPIKHRHGRLSYLQYAGSTYGCVETSHYLFRTNKKGVSIISVTLKGETETAPLISLDGFSEQRAVGYFSGC